MRVEGALLDAAGCLDPGDAAHAAPPDIAMEGITVAHAIQLWRLNGKRYNRFKGPVSGSLRWQPMLLDEIRAELICKAQRIQRVSTARGERGG